MEDSPAIPAITTAQMAEVDRLMIEEYGILLIQMMENAGRNLAEQARRMLGGDLTDRRIVVLCGAGNNGGGGMVAARHLHNRGARVQAKYLSVNCHIHQNVSASEV
ncbi:MAG: NAD(P)H-hydrate epimerase, partial [Aggregatilineaceae bacterium]